ncbi:hypothetical protein GCM10007874_04660 [Labrys miyagiensis]|uniref:Integrase DNA-binding domain-containing protein n=1 Tax=Labrys miyagiensis TaxID=346912 RepID=A0ABQ6CGM1_9HYPH|nr:Arm DNA-binding domain-containing protein [Labrys miyagiensis]GLS17451.1 hypothetical protein GCM10007874_04660 [Labrys miyagiensis]
MPLADIECRTAKPTESTRKLSDGQGLQLWIMPNGSKLWRQDYRYAGKRKLLAIGPYPAITLVAARKAQTRRDTKMAGHLRQRLIRKTGYYPTASLATTAILLIESGEPRPDTRYAGGATPGLPVPLIMNVAM